MNGQKKKHYIYLAGNISEDMRTYEWREKFTELVKDEPLITVVDPCANSFNQSMRTGSKDGMSFTKRAVKKSQKILRAKDYQLIKICSVVVVNLSLTNEKKPMVGTIQELCWCRDIFYVPVIGITEGVDNVYTLHPWIDECCSAKVETVEEAVQMVKDFFLDY